YHLDREAARRGEVERVRPVLDRRRLHLVAVGREPRVDLVDALATRLDEPDVKAARVLHAVTAWPLIPDPWPLILSARFNQRQDHPAVVGKQLHAGISALPAEVEVLREERARLFG